MAIRNIVKEGDGILGKKCRPVEKFDRRLHILLDDMAETLADANGAGLAAPQVGVLRRVFIMDFGDGKGVIEAVNPRIVERRGKQEDVEGCLSSPGEYGITRRPRRVKMVAQDRFGKEFTFEGEDLSARCVCHEYDHLDGILFKQHVVRMLDPEDLA